MLKVTANHAVYTPTLRRTQTVVQELQQAATGCHWPVVSQKAQQLMQEGRIVVLQSLQDNHSFNPLPIAEHLLNTLASSSLQWEDDIKYHLSRATRLFLELSCMKAVNEKRDIYRTTQESLRSQLDTLLEHARVEEVALRYELKCASEALKLMETIDYKAYLQTLFAAAIDPGLGSVATLLKLIPPLLKQRSKAWFTDVLFINWFTPHARSSSEVYQHIVEILQNNLTKLEVTQSGVEFFADIVWHGTPELQERALQATPGLLTLLNQQKPPRTVFKLHPLMWPVRYRTVQVLTTLTTHPQPTFSPTVTTALLQRRLQESNPHVKQLLLTLEKTPAIAAQWKAQFEQEKADVIQQNLQEQEELRHEEAHLHELEQKLRDAQTQGRATHDQLKTLEQSIQQEREYVQLLRTENEAHRQNVDELHYHFKKGVNDILDDIFDHSTRPAATPPPHFCCPITQELMVEPVLAEDGRSYERAALEKWLATHDTSPLTGERFATKHLVLNRSLKDAIEEFAKQAGISLPPPSPGPTSSRSSGFQPPIPSTKEAYRDLLIQLHDHPEIQKHAGLQDVLASLFEELSHDESPQLTPGQERTYSLVQKLLSNGKVATLVASSLLKLKTKQPSAPAPKSAVAPPSYPVLALPPMPTALPAIAFGAALWNKHFGDVGVEPALPPDIEQILNGPCPIWPSKKVHETHLLVLVPQRVNGQPLNLRMLGEVVKKPLQGPATKYEYFNQGEYKDPDAPASHWVLLSRDVIPGSRNKTYGDQQKLVQRYAGYEVPNVLDATVALFMEHVRSGTWLYRDSPWTFTQCQEKYNSNWQLVVGGFSAAGLHVSNNYDADEDDGVGVQRKF